MFFISITPIKKTYGIGNNVSGIYKYLSEEYEPSGDKKMEMGHTRDIKIELTTII